MSEKGRFTLIKKVSFEEMSEGVELSESDLCFQDDKHIYQFKYHEPEKEKKQVINPGIYSLEETNSSLVTKKTEVRDRQLLTSIVNTQSITNEANLFFDNLDVYKKLGEPMARKILLYSDPGMGKCLGEDTPVLMYDGEVKMVQDVETGDLLMGPDSTPRTVLSTTSGRETLYRITPNKGDSYIVNESHILSLRMSGSDEICNLTVKEYLDLPNWKQERLKGWRTGVDFESDDELPINPYLLGLWLGDGSSCKSEICSADRPIQEIIKDHFTNLGLDVLEYPQANGLVAYRASSGQKYGKKNRNILTNMLRQLSVWGNKHIPLIYKTASNSDRLKLLAGLVDSDGSYNDGVYDFNLKSEQLANDIAFLARSLGFAAYIKENEKTCHNSKTKAIGTYYRVQISGDLDEVPSQLTRKQAKPRKQIKNVLRTGIKVEKLEVGDYYGFTLDGDRLFLLGDFTVTHNTATITQFCQNAIQEDPGTVVLIWPTSEIDADDVSHFLSKDSEYSDKCTRLILIMEDIGGGEREGNGGARGVDSAMLDLLDGIQVTFRLPTLIIATTNYPQNLLSALADRPGRFDLILQLKPPSYEERIELVEFIGKEPISDEDKKALAKKGAEEFSVAHLKEIVIRSLLHKKSLTETVDEMIEHRKRFKKAFDDQEELGFGR